MKILYCGDKGIVRGVLISVLSILKHNTEPLEIYVATIKHEKTEPFSREAAEFLDKLVKGDKEVGLAQEFAKNTNKKSFVKLIDATEVFVANLPRKNMGSYFTPCSMLRLYADKISELAGLDRLLYLDYDIVCRGDITEFYHTDLEEIEAAGVLDIYGKHFYRYHGIFKRKDDPDRKLPKNEQSRGFLKQDYMNSGVMLFNMSECVKTGMFGRAVELCGRRWMMLADQAALNKAISQRKLMPRKYNEQGERPRKDTVLHHFSNNFKFWPYFRVQKVKPFEINRVHQILKITEYDDILVEYNKMKEKL